MMKRTILDRDRARDGLLDLLAWEGFDRTQALSERTLAAELEVGRTPMREAIRDLARDGILEVVPGQGTFVRRSGLEDLRELYEVRHALEGKAAQLAAERGMTEELNAFITVFEDLAKIPEPDPVVIQEHNDRFHLAIFDAAGNRTLTGIYETIRARIRGTLHMTRRYDVGRVRRTVGEHLEVLRAIEAGDAGAARRAMHDHLANGYAARVEILVGIAPEPET